MLSSSDTSSQKIQFSQLSLKMPAQQFKFLEVGPTLAVQSLDTEQSPSDATRLIHEVHYTLSLHKVSCDLGIEFLILFGTLWVITISIHITLRWKNSSPTTSDVTYASPSPIPVPPPALVMQEPLISEASSSSDESEGESPSPTLSSELLQDVQTVINQPLTLLPILTEPPAPEVASTEIDPSNHT